MAQLYNPRASTIAGLTPTHFVTLATPHLGCDAQGEAQVSTGQEGEGRVARGEEAEDGRAGRRGTDGGVEALALHGCMSEGGGDGGGVRSHN